MAEDRLVVLFERLEAFQGTTKAVTKGPLATVLFLTRRVSENGLPFPLDSLRTKKRGQVAGLGREPVQKILSDHGIRKVLAEEGGRTSRGSLGLAEQYIDLLNKLYEEEILRTSQLPLVEDWWIAKVREYFNRQSFKVNVDPNFSISKVVSSVLLEARKRQEAAPGMTIEGAVLQHLVGAKLSLMLGEANVEHHGSSVADAASDRAGDFQIADSAIHATTSPTERLIAKCRENLSGGLRPIIVCLKDKVAGALLLADNAGIKDRVEVYDAETFISTNVNELAGFEEAKLKTTTQELFQRYNEIVSKTETDSSLLIEAK